MKKEATIHEDMQKVKDKFKETTEALSETAHHMKDRAGEFLSESYRDVKEKSYDIEQQVVSYVKENPLKSIGFGLLTGAVIALLLRK